MTTTNVYQGLSGDKSTSRVLQAPGGGSSNIFGHYQAENDREKAQQHQRDTEAVMQSAAMGVQRNGGDAGHNYQDNKDSYAANRQRNQGEGAPFATNNSMVSAPAEKVIMQAPIADGDYQTPKQQQAANRMRNHGSEAPFATGDFGQAREQTDGFAQSHGTDYLTPQQRQANNPNKAGNSFSNLFGDSGPDGPHGKSKGKVSTHNPVTWEAYSSFDAAQDHPQHRSRFENFASTKAGTFNPITGEEHVASIDGKTTSTKVHAPPGGQSSIQF